MNVSAKLYALEDSGGKTTSVFRFNFEHHRVGFTYPKTNCVCKMNNVRGELTTCQQDKYDGNSASYFKSE